ncbi:hypothetical protein NEOLEDRAFT_1181817 [Neolentinus lepideus HHB14362 ss-1]|uniref:DUF6534 domain-containing protein n=1 Tax=Neolentinus lepideus HHB14362 ss-1 TaxID=1314782 RepID=A0A165PPW7_9AGAM|nr:hypothetical protein NEOLEDRAFT_1181817 [Neolentinus lepideus HHB14362 ss-1]
MTEIPASTVAHQFGAAFLGVVVGAILFGITVLQTSFYYNNYRQDKIYYRISVGVLCCLDALHLSFSVHMIYHYLINSTGTPNPADAVIWSLKALAVVNVVVIWMVQSLYSLRVWQLSRATSKLQSSDYNVQVTVIVIAVITIAAFGVGCTFIKEVTHLSDLTVHHWWLYMGNATSAFIDTVLAGMMVVIIYRHHRTEKGEISRRSIPVLSALVQYCVGSGLLTRYRHHLASWLIPELMTAFYSIVATAMVVLYSIKSDSLVYLAFVFVITKLYVNSFIAVLNLRVRLRRSLDQPPTFDLRNIDIGNGDAGDKGITGRLEIDIHKPLPTIRPSQTDNHEIQSLMEISPSAESESP